MLKAVDAVDAEVGLFLDIRVGLVEWKHLFLLSLELSAQFGCFEYFFSEFLVGGELLDAVECTH